ncbi:MAG: hypothetical protein KJ921_02790, partial [Proteobacteria bacterium]|nr:hypothetical protein [Pseudomonadota bacterium]
MMVMPVPLPFMAPPPCLRPQATVFYFRLIYHKIATLADLTGFEAKPSVSFLFNPGRHREEHLGKDATWRSSISPRR